MLYLIKEQIKYEFSTDKLPVITTMDTQFSANEQHLTLYCLEIEVDFGNKARDTSISFSIPFISSNRPRGRLGRVGWFR